MPGGDRTGPRGQGPMTGRGAGYCSGQDRQGYDNPDVGLGTRFGGRFGRRGGGFGYRHWYHATGQPYWARFGNFSPTSPPEPELGSLRNEAERLRGELEVLNQRISELEKKE